MNYYYYYYYIIIIIKTQSSRGRGCVVDQSVAFYLTSHTNYKATHTNTDSKH